MKRILLAAMFVLSMLIIASCEYEEKHYPDKDYYYWGPQHDSHPDGRDENKEHQ